MIIFKKWKEKRKKRKELIAKSNEMLVDLINFFRRDYENLCTDILKRHPDVDGFKLTIDNNFTYKGFLLQRFELKLIDISDEMANQVDILFNGLVLYNKSNEKALMLLKELEDSITNFNSIQKFNFLKVDSEVHCLYDNGIYLIADIYSLEKYFEGENKNE